MCFEELEAQVKLTQQAQVTPSGSYSIPPGSYKTDRLCTQAELERTTAALGQTAKCARKYLYACVKASSMAERGCQLLQTHQQRSAVQQWHQQWRAEAAAAALARELSAAARRGAVRQGWRLAARASVERRYALNSRIQCVTIRAELHALAKKDRIVLGMTVLYWVLRQWDYYRMFCAVQAMHRKFALQRKGAKPGKKQSSAEGWQGKQQASTVQQAVIAPRVEIQAKQRLMERAQAELGLARADVEVAMRKNKAQDVEELRGERDSMQPALEAAQETLARQKAALEALRAQQCSTSMERAAAHSKMEQAAAHSRLCKQLVADAEEATCTATQRAKHSSPAEAEGLLQQIEELKQAQQVAQLKMARAAEAEAEVVEVGLGADNELVVQAEQRVATAQQELIGRREGARQLVLAQIASGECRVGCSVLTVGCCSVVASLEPL